MQQEVIKAVIAERARQDSLWGEQNHAVEKWMPILGEEFGELCEAVNETVFCSGSDRGGYARMMEEACHVAAVAVGFMECLARNRKLYEKEENRDG